MDAKGIFFHSFRRNYRTLSGKLRLALSGFVRWADGEGTVRVKRLSMVRG